jgi:heme A synthase
MLESRFAILTAVATFLLLVVGGTVNPTGSSLACPEAWFVCHGSMLPEMTGGVLYEHGHRLVAMTVGLLQIGLTWLLWRRRPELRALAVLALVLVCAQGSLGAATVYYKLPIAISTSHLMVAMLYFALVIYLAWRTRRPAAALAPIPTARAVRSAPSADMSRLHAAIGATAVLVYLQIALGALVRHTGGALACLDLPLCRGSLWPAGAALPLQVHMAHRIFGAVVALVVIAVGVTAARRLRDRPRLRRLAAAAPLLAAAQVTLGLLAIAELRAVPIVVAHVGLAAALWATWVILWLSTRPAAASADEPAGALVGQAVWQ